ncbi:hypothetical protein [Pedobacter sp. SYP-B3415]|uniref:hypothetical protein n=1 Tax=Pedobacter sp. SYP-B3415 TaxID=2496641 RepID=UPI00101D129D|nr:hypothetical protein [Pedobacter sp. SYP-B3415]
MSAKTKKIFLALTIIVPFLAYCIIYYAPMIRNAPFRSKDFVSFQYSYGLNAVPENRYDSKTGDYTYLNSKDSVIRANVKLRKNDIIYIHNKANELGLWNFPELIANPGTDTASSKALRYHIVFKYRTKTKKVTYFDDYRGSEKLRDAARQMFKVIDQSLSDAEERYGKQAH